MDRARQQSSYCLKAEGPAAGCLDAGGANWQAIEAIVLIERLRDGARGFGWKPSEIVSLLRTEGDRIISVVADPVTGLALKIVDGARELMGEC